MKIKSLLFSFDEGGRDGVPNVEVWIPFNPRAVLHTNERSTPFGPSNRAGAEEMESSVHSTNHFEEVLLQKGGPLQQRLATSSREKDKIPPFSLKVERYCDQVSENTMVVHIRALIEPKNIPNTSTEWITVSLRNVAKILCEQLGVRSILIRIGTTVTSISFHERRDSHRTRELDPCEDGPDGSTL